MQSVHFLPDELWWYLAIFGKYMVDLQHVRLKHPMNSLYYRYESVMSLLWVSYESVNERGFRRRKYRTTNKETNAKLVGLETSAFVWRTIPRLLSCFCVCVRFCLIPPLVVGASPCVIDHFYGAVMPSRHTWRNLNIQSLFFTSNEQYFYKQMIQRKLSDLFRLTK